MLNVKYPELVISKGYQEIIQVKHEGIDNKIIVLNQKSQ